VELGWVVGSFGFLWRDLIDSFFDRRCPGCVGPVPRDREVCDACDAAVSRTGTVLCLACLRRDPATRDARGACSLHGSRRLALVGPSYEPTLERIIHAFKYEGSRRLATWLAALYPDPPERDRSFGREAVLVPVPLHPTRRAARSYDQAELLAEELSARWGIPVVRALARVRDTPPQARLGPGRRHANVRGAFQGMRPLLVANRPVLLVDDVVTTGSTMMEAAEALEAQGAAWILSLAAAHGGHPDPAEGAIQGAVASFGDVC
jgi:competence protein ComFC